MIAKNPPPAMKPFTVVLDGRRFRFTRTEKWFVVSCLDEPKISTQGRTFEEAASMAVEAVREVLEFEKDLRQTKPVRKPARPARRRRVAEAIA